jgi:hypothetical protein
MIWSQFFSHFLRQAKGRLQTGQVLEGKCCFLTPCIKKGLAYERQTLLWKDCFKLEQISAGGVATAN